MTVGELVSANECSAAFGQALFYSKRLPDQSRGILTTNAASAGHHSPEPNSHWIQTECTVKNKVNQVDLLGSIPIISDVNKARIYMVDYIELKRTYSRIDQITDRFRGCFGDLFKTDANIVIVLGDKGSGKTTEIKQFYDKNADSSVWVQLDSLASSNDSLVKELEKLFLHKAESYHLLFDSIDECRMRNTKSDMFAKALENLTDALGRFPQKLDKIKILFTSRESDWRGDKGLDDILQGISYDIDSKDTDVKLIESHLSSLSGLSVGKECTTKPFIPVINVFKLDALSPKQQEIIADYYKIDKKFCKAPLFNTFAETPLACMQSLQFLRQNQGADYSMDDFFMYQLRYRYRELNDFRNADLPMDKISMMAKRMAAATLLKRTFSIKKNETYHTLPDAESISALELFPEEQKSTIDSFVNSTLFSSNGLDKVKFWNEDTKNYIAHLWVKDRIANGKYRKIKKLLFNNGHPRNSFIQSLIALSNTEPEIHKLLIDNHPELFIINSYFCDNLPTSDKEHIIADVLNKYHHRLRWMFRWGRGYTIANFVRGVSVEFLLECLEMAKSDANDYDLMFILELMYGIHENHLNSQQIKNIKDAIIPLVESRSSSVRYNAVEILTKFTDEDNVKYLVQLFADVSSKSDKSLIELLLRTLYPKYITITDVFNKIVQYRSVYNDRNDFEFPLSYNIQEFLENLYNHNELYLALDVLKTHLEDVRILELYEDVLLRLIMISKSPNECVDYLLDLCEFEYGHYTHNQSKFVQIKNALISLPNINKTLMLKATERMKQVPQTYKGGHCCFIRVVAKYCEYDDDCARIYLNTLKDVDFNSIGVYLLRDAVSHFIDKSHDLAEQEIAPYLSLPEVAHFWESVKNPQPEPKSKWQLEDEELQKKQDEEKANNLKALNDDLPHMRALDDKGVHALFWISTQVMDGFGGEPNLSDFRQRYGDEITDTFVESIKKYWQISDINLNEYLDTIGTDKILIKSMVCLVGLDLFFQNNPDAELDEHQAEQAIYYGLQALNSVPNYVIENSDKYPNVAQRIIIPIIKKTIEKSANEHPIFWKLLKLKPETLNGFYPYLWGVLEGGAGGAVSYSIAKVISLMNLNDVQRDKFCNYLAGRIGDLDSADINCWLGLLYKTDPKVFIAKIQELEFVNKENIGGLSKFFESLFASLSDLDNYNLNMDILLVLVPMVYKYINVNQDIHRENMGMYSPTERDKAQSFRGHLTNLLNERYLSRNDLPKLHKLIAILEKIEPNTANYLRSNADKLLFKEEDAPWSENKIVSFELDDYVEPTNADELFDITVSKLLDIKEDIETSDYSIRDLYQDLKVSGIATESKKITKEKHFQKYLLMELRRISNKLYSAVREPEADNNKKPDLQIWNKSWCINIECKIADNWSLNALKDSIDKQLIGRYLKYPKYQHGIFLLARIQHDNWNKLNFDKLIEELQKYANSTKTRAEYSHIKDIKVMGIDYSIKDK